MDIQEIKLDNLPSSNFGPGVELLMNGRKKDIPEEINLSDITKLEQDLNDLSSTISGATPATTSFNISSSLDDAKDIKQVFTPKMPSFGGVRFDDVKHVEPTTPLKNESESWDGFRSVNTGGMGPEKPSLPPPELSAGEVLKNKFRFLRKLEEFESKGISLTRKYTMESSLAEMQGEYENIVAEKERQNSMKFQGKMLMACITGVEFLNSKFDPFDIKLDGWAEQVSENLEDYDDIFAELHDKYKSKAKMAPELKLMFQLGGSAIMLHMTNSMFKSSVPGMDDIMRQNPELMQKFTQAAVNSMSNSNPGFTNFMSNVQPPQRREARVEEVRETRSPRPEMRGPSTDINDLLAGLKPKTSQPPPAPMSDYGDDPGSTVSLSELNEMKEGLKAPKSKRRMKSDKNTVSIII